MRDYAFAETHVSQVVLTPTHALKFKKCLKTPFLDFSTPEKRREACETEVALNRRLAPDVYLDVATLSGPDLGVIDYAVVMRRLPAERSLSSLASNDIAAARQQIPVIADVLARFHKTALRGPQVDAEATVASLRMKLAQNTAELHALTDHGGFERMIEAIATLAERYLDGREDLFVERIDSGRIVDGHGDLLADDVFCLDDGPRLLDCLEFSDSLRYCDVLADAAFLAMDLESHGNPELARQFLSDFALASSDTWPDSLMDFYIAYRAQIRAKVALLRGDDVAADKLLRLAVVHLRQTKVRVVMLGGAPATGKSTVARALASRGGFVVIRSDTVRKELAGVPVLVRRHDAVDEGMYTPARTRATYRELIDRAAHHVARGESVVLDAGWRSELDRHEARQVAKLLMADVVELQCVTDRHTAMQRAGSRERRDDDASDAGPALVNALWDASDPWPEAAIIDTSDASPNEVADKVLRLVHRDLALSELT